MSTLSQVYSFHGITKAYLEGLVRSISEAAWENIILIFLALIAASGSIEILQNPLILWGGASIIPILYAIQMGRTYGPYWGGQSKNRVIAVFLGRSTTMVAFAGGVMWLATNVLNNQAWRGFINASLHNSALLVWHGMAWYLIIFGLSQIIPFGVASLKFKVMVEHQIQQQRLQQQQQGQRYE